MRKVADCRAFPGLTNCTVTIGGEEKHVLDAAVAHAVASHGHEDTPELRRQIQSMLMDEQDVYPGGPLPPKKQAEEQPSVH